MNVKNEKGCFGGMGWLDGEKIKKTFWQLCCWEVLVSDRTSKITD